MRHLVLTMAVLLNSIFIVNAIAADNESMKLFLKDSSHSEFVDFIYDFAKANRLNVQWFGWHSGLNENDGWFKKSDQPSRFKIGIYMLTEENGHLFFSNRFDDEHRVNINIDYGDRKSVWLDAVNVLMKELEIRGWVVE